MIVTGLILDILGAVLVCFFGLPPSVTDRGITYRSTHEVDEGQQRKARVYDHIARAGLIFLVAGFALQLYGNLN